MSSQVKVMIMEQKVIEKVKETIEKNIDGVNNWRIGRILTLIDASIQDVEQRKALKDIIKDIMYDRGEYFTMDIEFMLLELDKKFVKSLDHEESNEVQMFLSERAYAYFKNELPKEEYFN